MGLRLLTQQLLTCDDCPTPPGYKTFLPLVGGHETSRTVECLQNGAALIQVDKV